MSETEKCKLCGGDLYDGYCENLTDTTHQTLLFELIECQDKLLVAYRLQKRPADKTLDRINVIRRMLNL